VLGMTFKENCPDIRNSRVIDVIRELQSFGCRVDVADPWADAGEVMHEYGVTLVPYEQVSSGALFARYSTVVFAVKHDAFSTLSFARDPATTVVYDIKATLPRAQVDGRL